MKNRNPFQKKLKSHFFRQTWASQSGQGLTEYITLVLLVAVISIAAAQSLGKTIKKKIEMAERHIEGDISLEKKD